MFGQLAAWPEPAAGAVDPAAGAVVEPDVDEDELGVLVDVELSAA
jgi:hypothetical protein